MIPAALAVRGVRDVATQSLRTWMAQFERGEFKASLGASRLTADQLRIRDLERELAIAKMEREILKKATAHFASPRKASAEGIIFGTLKTESLHHYRFATREQARQVVFESIDDSSRAGFARGAGGVLQSYPASCENR